MNTVYFHQPSGFSAEAENLDYLPGGGFITSISPRTDHAFGLNSSSRPSGALASVDKR